MSRFLSSTPNYFLIYRAISTHAALREKLGAYPIKGQISNFLPVGCAPIQS